MAYQIDGEFISNEKEQTIKKEIMSCLKKSSLTVNSARCILSDIIDELGKTPL